MTPTPGQPLSEADVSPCTDCDDSGITHQTERACSCAAGDAYRPHAPVSRPGDGVEGWIEALDRLKMAAHVYEDDEMAAGCATLDAALTPPAEPVSRPAGEGEAVAWPVVTDQWAETYCELTGRDPDGQQVTFVDGGTVTTFRDMARREIEAMLCAAPKAAVRAIAALRPGGER